MSGFPVVRVSHVEGINLLAISRWQVTTTSGPEGANQQVVVLHGQGTGFPHTLKGETAQRFLSYITNIGDDLAADAAPNPSVNTAEEGLSNRFRDVINIPTEPAVDLSGE